MKKIGETALINWFVVLFITIDRELYIGSNTQLTSEGPHRTINRRLLVKGNAKMVSETALNT